MTTKRFWIKLYLEILDDPKMGQLPDWLWRRAIELFLLAGENGNDGLLQPVTDLAWRLRVSAEKLTESLQALSEVGVVHETPQGWTVTNFKKRQEAVSSTERVRQYRKRDCNDDETKRYKICNENDVSSSIYVSVSDSFLEERGVGGETKPPPSPAEAEFVAHFRTFNGKREVQRWETLVEAIGMVRAQEIAAWAERKEIHLTNRGGLLDSLETAARKWVDNPGAKTNFLEQLKVA
ncbi:MAG: hypothetical protein NTW99_00300 [Chloroflexi bacterium]|nr:hypothetical protein [Chloroflexota bacterium]